MKKYIFITVIALITFFANTAESIQISDFVEAARTQIGTTLVYDPSYQVIDYPNGDVSIDRGVCTDVIVRAMRVAYNYDLQKFVHEDIKKNFLNILKYGVQKNRIKILTTGVCLISGHFLKERVGHYLCPIISRNSNPVIWLLV